MHNLFTPKNTPLPTPPDTENTNLSEIATHQQFSISVNVAPRANQISADLDSSKIILEGVKRQSKPTSRKDAYITQLSNVHKLLHPHTYIEFTLYFTTMTFHFTMMI